MICQQDKQVCVRFGSTHNFRIKATVQAQMLEITDGWIRQKVEVGCENDRHKLTDLLNYC